MALELVTGKGPSNHITSAQIGALNAGIFGTGRYILKTSDRLALSVSGNTATVAAGDAVIDGRHVTQETAVDFTIPNGTQGQLRYDLIVIRYEDNNSIESAELVYLQGEPSATAPRVPTYNSGSILDGDSAVDVPLYQISMSGTSVSSTKARLSEAVTNSDALSAIEAAGYVYRNDVPVTPSGGSLDYSNAVFNGRNLFLCVNMTVSSDKAAGANLFSIPAEFAPSVPPFVNCVTIDSGTPVTLNDAGFVTFDGSGSAVICKAGTPIPSGMMVCLSCVL